MDLSFGRIWSELTDSWLPSTRLEGLGFSRLFGLGLRKTTRACNNLAEEKLPRKEMS